MDYSQRYTERLFLEKDAEDTEETVENYFARAKANVIANRLGLYEDLGYSPAELAEILLQLDMVDADRKELIKLAQKRIEVFDKQGYYLSEGVLL